MSLVLLQAQPLQMLQAELNVETSKVLLEWNICILDLGMDNSAFFAYVLAFPFALHLL